MLEEKIAYWREQIELFGKQTIDINDLNLIEKTMKDLEEENERLSTELMMIR